MWYAIRFALRKLLFYSGNLRISAFSNTFTKYDMRGMKAPIGVRIRFCFNITLNQWNYNALLPVSRNHTTVKYHENATSISISVISWWCFFWLRKPEKTIDLQQVADKLYHTMLYGVHLVWMGFELTFVVIDTDCRDSHKSMISSRRPPYIKCS